jgi:hypothetical protein
MNRKGICYDVGRVMMGSNWRPKFDPEIVRRELEIIKGDLHCNAVRICGLDIDRLVTASEVALSQGLEVWFSPEMWDRNQEETLPYLKKAAEAAESLRKQWPDKVVFSVGSEATLFTQGIIEGNNVFERMSNPAFWTSVKEGRHNKALNAFLAEANQAVREVFCGKVTYFSVPLEAVDWSMFDYVGVDLYRDARTKDVFSKLASIYHEYNKPVMIGECGCCTYRGADMLGGSGFIVVFGMMADYLGAKAPIPKPFGEMLKVIPKADGHYIRDESLQAREIVEQLAAFDDAGVEGAFVFTFAAQTSPYTPDPRFDMDMGSYSLVKSYPQKETVNQMPSQDVAGVEIPPELLAALADEMGKHGTTYPDMPWEPKESFKAVADCYSSH